MTVRTGLIHFSLQGYFSDPSAFSEGMEAALDRVFGAFGRGTNAILLRNLVLSPLAPVDIAGIARAVCRRFFPGMLDDGKFADAFREAVKNAVIHGNKNAADNLVMVRWRFGDELLSVDVIDQGAKSVEFRAAPVSAQQAGGFYFGARKGVASYMRSYLSGRRMRGSQYDFPLTDERGRRIGQIIRMTIPYEAPKAAQRARTPFARGPFALLLPDSFERYEMRAMEGEEVRVPVKNLLLAASHYALEQEAPDGESVGKESRLFLRYDGRVRKMLRQLILNPRYPRLELIRRLLQKEQSGILLHLEGAVSPQWESYFKSYLEHAERIVKSLQALERTEDSKSLAPAVLTVLSTEDVLRWGPVLEITDDGRALVFVTDPEGNSMQITIGQSGPQAPFEFEVSLLKKEIPSGRFTVPSSPSAVMMSEWERQFEAIKKDPAFVWLSAPRAEMRSDGTPQRDRDLAAGEELQSVMDYLDLSTRTFGELVAEKIGKDDRVRHSVVLEWLNGTKTPEASVLDGARHLLHAEIGDHVKAFREALGYSVDGMAPQLGVTPEELRSWEAKNSEDSGVLIPAEALGKIRALYKAEAGPTLRALRSAARADKARKPSQGDFGQWIGTYLKTHGGDRPFTRYVREEIPALDFSYISLMENNKRPIAPDILQAAWEVASAKSGLAKDILDAKIFARAEQRLAPEQVMEKMAGYLARLKDEAPNGTHVHTLLGQIEDRVRWARETLSPEEGLEALSKYLNYRMPAIWPRGSGKYRDVRQTLLSGRVEKIVDPVVFGAWWRGSFVRKIARAAARFGGRHGWSGRVVYGLQTIGYGRNMEREIRWQQMEEVFRWLRGGEADLIPANDWVSLDEFVRRLVEASDQSLKRNTDWILQASRFMAWQALPEVQDSPEEGSVEVTELAHKLLELSIRLDWSLESPRTSSHFPLEAARTLEHFRTFLDTIRFSYPPDRMTALYRAHEASLSELIRMKYEPVIIERALAVLRGKEDLRTPRVSELLSQFDDRPIRVPREKQEEMLDAMLRSETRGKAPQVTPVTEISRQEMRGGIWRRSTDDVRGILFKGLQYPLTRGLALFFLRRFVDTSVPMIADIGPEARDPKTKLTQPEIEQFFKELLPTLSSFTFRGEGYPRVARFHILGIPFYVVRNPETGYMENEGRPGDAYFNLMYSLKWYNKSPCPTYFGRRDDASWSFDIRLASARERVQSEIMEGYREYFPDLPKDSVLDVGSGTNILALGMAFKEQGWKTVVMQEPYSVSDSIQGDLDKQSIERVPDLAGLIRTNRQFKLVTALTVLEHVPDPTAFLKQLAAVTVPGGMVFLRIPNTPAKGIPAVAIMEHINHFDMTTIGPFLKEAGLEWVGTVDSSRTASGLPSINVGVIARRVEMPAVLRTEMRSGAPASTGIDDQGLLQEGAIVPDQKQFLGEYTRNFVAKHAGYMKSNPDEILESLLDPVAFTVPIKPLPPPAGKEGLADWIKNVQTPFAKIHKDFINGMPSEIRNRVVQAKLSLPKREAALRAYLRRMAAGSPEVEKMMEGFEDTRSVWEQGFEITGVVDFSSTRAGRDDEDAMVLKITLQRNGQPATLFLKQICQKKSKDPRLAGRQVDKFESYFNDLAQMAGLPFVRNVHAYEEDDPRISSYLFMEDIKGTTPYRHFYFSYPRLYSFDSEDDAASMVKQLAESAAMSDLTNRGDRRAVIFPPFSFGANFIIVREDGRPVIYAIDHGWMFNRDSGFLRDDIRRGKGELAVLLGMPGWRSAEGREKLRLAYREAYVAQWEKMTAGPLREKVLDLTGETFGSGSQETEIIQKAMERSPGEEFDAHWQALLDFSKSLEQDVPRPEFVRVSKQAGPESSVGLGVPGEDALLSLLPTFPASSQVWIDRNEKDALRVWLATVEGSWFDLSLKRDQDQPSRVVLRYKYDGDEGVVQSIQGDFALNFTHARGYANDIGHLAQIKELQAKLKTDWFRNILFPWLASRGLEQVVVETPFLQEEEREFLVRELGFAESSPDSPGSPLVLDLSLPGTSGAAVSGMMATSNEVRQEMRKRSDAKEEKLVFAAEKAAGEIADYVLGRREEMPRSELYRLSVRTAAMVKRVGVEEFLAMYDAAVDQIEALEMQKTAADPARLSEQKRQAKAAIRAFAEVLRNTDKATAITFNLKGREGILRDAIEAVGSPEKIVALLANGTLAPDVSGLKTEKIGDVAHARPRAWVQGVEVANEKVSLVIQVEDGAIDLSGKPDAVEIDSTRDEEAYGAFSEVVDQVARIVIAALAGDVITKASDLNDAEKRKQLVGRFFTHPVQFERLSKQYPDQDFTQMFSFRNGKISVNLVMFRLLTEHLASKALASAA
ncbi:MAG: class I SAM-dependent methyltransferase [Candidatus Omnitrophota bacterium]|jgi:hypothetical protein